MVARARRRDRAGGRAGPGSRTRNHRPKFWYVTLTGDAAPWKASSLPDSMCRLLAITSAAPVDSAAHLRAFADVARNSREYQGHGWGCAWPDGEAWRAYHSIRPIWEDDLERFGQLQVLVAHARSAFRDERIAVENNMPFLEDGLTFVFNGELRGVRIAEAGRIGAEKLFRFLVRHGAARGEAEMRTALRLVAQRTRYVRALNAVIAGGGRFLVCSRFSEDDDYFTMWERREDGMRVVCSEPYGEAPGWTAIANGAVEEIPWYS
jgi:predicted glutamine amidotransferase